MAQKIPFSNTTASERYARRNLLKPTDYVMHHQFNP